MLDLFPLALMPDAKGCRGPDLEALRTDRFAANLAAAITSIFDTLERMLHFVELAAQVTADGEITLAQKELGSILGRMIFYAVAVALILVFALILDLVDLSLQVAAHLFELDTECIQIKG
jgi:hypothetical protein